MIVTPQAARSLVATHALLEVARTERWFDRYAETAAPTDDVAAEFLASGGSWLTLLPDGLIAHTTHVSGLPYARPVAVAWLAVGRDGRPTREASC